MNADDVESLAFQNIILNMNLFAYCMNDSVNGQDPMGYGMVITAPKRCPSEPLHAIKDSGLQNKSMSVFTGANDQYIGCTDLGNGFHVYTFAHGYSATYRRVSQYLVGAMTAQQWGKYLNGQYGLIENIQGTIGLMNEAIGGVYGAPDQIVIGMFLLDLLSYIPNRKKEYIKSKVPTSTKKEMRYVWKDCCYWTYEVESVESNKIYYLAMTVESQEQVFASGNIFSPWPSERKKRWKKMRQKQYAAW